MIYFLTYIMVIYQQTALVRYSTPEKFSGVLKVGVELLRLTK